MKTIVTNEGRQQIREVNKGYWLPVSSLSRDYRVVKPWYADCQQRLDKLVQRYSTAG